MVPQLANIASMDDDDDKTRNLGRVAHTKRVSPPPALETDLIGSPPVGAGYAIGHVLGSGGLSVVYAVVDVQGRELALKVSQRTGSTELLALQQTELELLARLRHPAVV